MNNKAKLKKQIRTVYTLRGIFVSLVFLLIAVLIGIAVTMFMSVNFVRLAIELIIAAAAGGLIGFLLSFFKVRSVLRPIEIQERAAGAGSFDRDEIRPACNSGTIYTGNDWLVWHKGLSTKAWYRDNIASLTGTPNGDGKVSGVLQLTTAGGRQEKMIYRRSEADLVEELGRWLFPVQEEPELIPAGEETV